MAKTKILIAGIGGVGGYFGGLLAHHFYNQKNIEVSFLARGAHLKAIQEKGLCVRHDQKEFIAHPHKVSDQATVIGPVDYILLATKTYDLATTVLQLQPCIHAKTIILPLLNGVANRNLIKSIYPEVTVLEGCAYIVSRLQSPGCIVNSGNIQRLFFGIDNGGNTLLVALETLLKAAGIEATYTQNISSIIWEKFIFLSPIATATSYFDSCIGELLNSHEKFTVLTTLIDEILQLAHAKQLTLAADIKPQTLHKLKALPYAATSSMHTDFKENKPHNELEALTGYVLQEAHMYQLELPTYRKLYKALQKRNKL